MPRKQLKELFFGMLSSAHVVFCAEKVGIGGGFAVAGVAGAALRCEAPVCADRGSGRWGWGEASVASGGRVGRRAG